MKFVEKSKLVILMLKLIPLFAPYYLCHGNRLPIEYFSNLRNSSLKKNVESQKSKNFRAPGGL